MATPQQQRPSPVPWPPLLLAAALGAAIVLGRLYPLPWPGVNDLPAQIIGYGLGMLGRPADGVGHRHAAARRTPPCCRTSRPSRLVTHGAFGFRRNPIYMGEVLVFLGLAQATGNIWLAIVAPLFAVLPCSCLPSCPRSGIWRPASARSILPTRSARGAGSEGSRYPMARDEQEEEREFLADLEARTGRDSRGSGWRRSRPQRFADKNETIDWLRAQGIPFARASWLERIHCNGGRPIYLHQPPKAAGRGQGAAACSKADAGAARRRASARSPTSRRCWRRARATGRSTSCWRPRSAVPSPASVVTPKAAYISLGAPREFAAVTLHASELRLGLDLGDRPFDAQLQKAQHERARLQPSRTCWC